MYHLLKVYPDVYLSSVLNPEFQDYQESLSYSNGCVTDSNRLSFLLKAKTSYQYLIFLKFDL